jgi:thiamine-monophosphate kinase
MDKSEFRTVQSLGRSALIKELTENATVSRDEVLQGIGDDTAVSECGEDEAALFTSETFMEGVDFDLTYVPLHHLGYKVLSASVSDIYAMNGHPQTALVNLAVPNKLSVDMLKEIYRGIYAAASDYNVEVTGGDLTASHKTLAISVSCTGKANSENITYRHGAKRDDAICVTGDLGGALAGLRILMREKEFWQENEQQNFQPDLDEYSYVVQRQLVPKARRDMIDSFEKMGLVPHAMIDITQGLLSEIKQLTEASGVGAQLYQAALPIALETRNVADEMKEDVDKYALYGGEDLELLFTLPEKVLNNFEDKLDGITVIGKIEAAEEGIKMQTAEGDIVQFQED